MTLAAAVAIGIPILVLSAIVLTLLLVNRRRDGGRVRGSIPRFLFGLSLIPLVCGLALIGSSIGPLLANDSTSNTLPILLAGFVVVIVTVALSAYLYRRIVKAYRS